MWNNLDFKKKNVLFFGMMLLIVYLAYAFSFSHTLAAIRLHRQLTETQSETQDLNATLPQVSAKHNYYLAALKSYAVKGEDHENRLWQSISGVAIANAVEISFNPNPIKAADTAVIQKQIIEQQFNFRGDYFNMVKLLDSLSKTQDIGRIAALKISSIKEDSAPEKAQKLTLSLQLSAMVKP